MSRIEDDSWDIATGVGLTAVTIAASRAAETLRADPLIEDPYAAVLLGGEELRPVMANLMGAQDSTGSSGTGSAGLIDYHAARTRFFDRYLESAVDGGIRQHVILASGLDARAFRLSWPRGCWVFEIDQPSVLAYKERTLRRSGIDPPALWRSVGVDLRHGWREALTAAGFDAQVRTAWLAEGLLPFLSGTAQETLFGTMDALSASGSRLAVEAFNVSGGSLLEVIARHLDQTSNDPRSTDSSMQDLWYGDDDRADPVTWWSDRGWRVAATPAPDYLELCNRPILEGDSFAQLSTFVEGVKS